MRSSIGYAWDGLRDAAGAIVLGIGVGIFIAGLFVGAVLWVAWMFMLFIGVMHLETGWPPATIGYGSSIVIAILFTLGALPTQISDFISK